MSQSNRPRVFLLAVLVLVLIGIVALRYPNTDAPIESYGKKYVYSSETIKQQINEELEINLNVMELEYGDFIWAGMSRSWWSYFNFSIVNKSDYLQQVKLEENYFDVELYQNETLLYSIQQGFPDYYEPQTATIVPGGYHSNEKWIGAPEYIEYTADLPYGSYDIVGVFNYNATEYHLEGIKLEISKYGPISGANLYLNDDYCIHSFLRVTSNDGYTYWNVTVGPVVISRDEMTKGTPIRTISATTEWQGKPVFWPYAGYITRDLEIHYTRLD